MSLLHARGNSVTYPPDWLALSRRECDPRPSSDYLVRERRRIIVVDNTAQPLETRRALCRTIRFGVAWRFSWRTCRTCFLGRAVCAGVLARVRGFRLSPCRTATEVRGWRLTFFAGGREMGF